MMRRLHIADQRSRTSVSTTAPVQADLARCKRPVCGEFQFRGQPRSERGRCSVGASDMNRSVRTEAKVRRSSEPA